MLEAIGEIGGVEQAESGHRQLMSRLRLFDRFVQQRRPRPSRIADSIALEFEPGPQQFDLRRTADAIGPLNRDQMPRQPFLRDIGHAMAVPGLTALDMRHDLIYAP